jgi:ubiquinone/menaquinone biosynthesis C-methylase UbiE
MVVRFFSFAISSMNKLTLIPVLLREFFSPRTLPREPEPDLVMTDERQVDAYDQAGSIDGLMASSYLFHTARVSQVIQGRLDVVDLGCGPAIQLCQIAQFNPSIQFHGIDLSETMLRKARNNAHALGLQNVRFSQGDITAMPFLHNHHADAVISTMALHHLPTRDHLAACFREVNRILNPGGALYLVDFTRPKRLDTVIHFAYQNARHQPHLFTLDYERSLRAAFDIEEFRRTADAALPAQAEVISTFMVPLLAVIKTNDHPLKAEQVERLRALFAVMPRRYRSDLRDIRRFFGLGGLRNDPFRTL